MADRTKERAHGPDRAPAGIPELLLERYALDELPSRTRAELEERLARDPEAQARLEALRRSNAELLAQHPPERVVPEIERRARREATERRPAPRRSPIFLPAFGTLAAAAALFLMLRPPAAPPDPNPGAGLERTRLKGLKPTLLVFKKPAAGEQPQPLRDGAAVRSRTLLQIAYVAAGAPHGVVVSIDGRGEATLHHPGAPQLPSRLESGQVFLPSAYELDDAPLYERFFFVTSAAPIDAAAVLAAARRLAADKTQARHAPLALAPGQDQTSLLLVKKDGEGSGP